MCVVAKVAIDYQTFRSIWNEIQLVHVHFFILSNNLVNRITVYQSVRMFNITLRRVASIRHRFSLSLSRSTKNHYKASRTT